MSEEEKVLRHFMDGKKLVLIDLESETIQLDKKEDKVKNGWILKHEPSVGEGYNFIAFDEDFKTIKQIAQEHFEENN